MSEDVKRNVGGCCNPPIAGLRRLTFPDGTQVGITGLDAAMEKLYRGGRPADERVGTEIMAELASENYFAPAARQAYEDLFLREYDRFLRARSASREKSDASAAAGNANSKGQKGRKRGLFRLLRRGEERARK